MKIQESGENYLETILMLEQKNGTVRSIDIANELEFSKPSVSRAMSILRTAGYITMDKNNLILLTEEGRRRAEAIYDRHCTLTRFLEALGISAENAVPTPAASSTSSARRPSTGLRISSTTSNPKTARRSDERPQHPSGAARTDGGAALILVFAVPPRPALAARALPPTTSGSRR